MTTSLLDSELKRRIVLTSLPVICMVVCSVWSSVGSSITVDEMAHLPAGLAIWDLNQFEIYTVNPPLVKMLAAAPVKYLDPVVDWSFAKRQPGTRNEFELGRIFSEQNSGRVLRFFQVARLACLPFSLLGCWVCYQWTSEIYGRDAALTALAAWCFSPLILGHGSLITPDVAAASTGALSVYRLRAWLRNPNGTNTAILGVCAGICLLTKFTWTPVLPVAFAMGWASWNASLFRRPMKWRLILRDLRQLVVAACIALLLINAVYDFDRSFVPLGNYQFFSRDFTGAAGSSREQSATTAESPVAPRNRFSDTIPGKIPVPLPACYLEGIDLQRRDFEPGRMGPSYLFGEWKDNGWWYYYIAGILVKEPVSFLVLFFGSQWMWIQSWCKRRKHPLTESGRLGEGESLNGEMPQLRDDVLVLIPPVLVFLLVSRETGFNHHVRYVIPSLPFLIIFASRILIYSSRWKIIRRVVFTLMLWQMASVLWFAPHWLSYFNELAGGPENGDRWLVGSNLDWGQDLGFLKKWQQQNPEALPLFTLLDSRYPPSIMGVPVHIPKLVEGKTAKDAGIEQQPDEFKDLVPEPGWYAVSVNLLQPYQGRLFTPPSARVSESLLRWFRKHKPVDRAGYSIRIFYVPEASHESSARIRSAKSEEAEVIALRLYSG